MKNIHSLLIIVLLPFFAVSQYGPQQIISTTANGAYKVFTADLNGNGFNDVIALCNVDYQIKWYENLDGNGNFGSETVLSDTPAYFLYFNAVDLNSNGHLDILYQENNPNRLIWKENSNGNGNFGPEQIILNNQSASIMEVKTFDLNNNSYTDIIIRYYSAFIDSIVWYENINGTGSFAGPNLLVDNIRNATGPLIVDIDNDGLPDLLLSHENSDAGRLVWYKNLGNQTFGTEQLIYQFDSLMSDWTSIVDIKYVDINTDGKYDIVIVSHNDDIGTYTHWLENIDNLGTFSGLKPLNIGSTYDFDFYDLDNDGDMDVLIYNRFANSIFWQENINGDGVWSQSKLISSDVLNLRHAIASNIKNNGNLEVISASYIDNKVAWYENVGLSISDFSKNNLSLYPNPAKNLITINSTEKISEISLFTVHGRKLDLQWDVDKIDITNLIPGIYLLKVTFENYTEVTKKIVKQ